MKCRYGIEKLMAANYGGYMWNKTKSLYDTDAAYWYSQYEEQFLFEKGKLEAVFMLAGISIMKYWHFRSGCRNLKHTKRSWILGKCSCKRRQRYERSKRDKKRSGSADKAGHTTIRTVFPRYLSGSSIP
jgi:hypothetical protein